MLYANTDDGSSALWVCDGNGIVVDNISIHGAERAPILEKINKHYGTTFTGWSDNEIGLRIGDSLPNWNAYEKIVLASQKIAAKSVSFGEDYFFIIGTLSGENFEIVTNGSFACIVNKSGIITGYNAPSASKTEDIIDILQRNGLSASTITEKIVSWESGSEVPDWAEYTQYK